MKRNTKRRDERLAQLGKAIRAQREAIGLSQEEVAERGGIERSYLGNVERGAINCTFLNLLKLAKGCGTTIEELMRRANF